MKVQNHPSNLMKVLYVLLAFVLIALGFNAYGNYQQDEFLKTLKGKAPTRKGK